jgi:hypothetical protein
MVQYKLEFGTVYDDVIFMPLMHLLSAISFNFMCILVVLHQKLETLTLVEIINIKPYPSVDDHFLFILCRS